MLRHFLALGRRVLKTLTVWPLHWLWGLVSLGELADSFPLPPDPPINARLKAWVGVLVPSGTRIGSLLWRNQDAGGPDLPAEVAGAWSSCEYWAVQVAGDMALPPSALCSRTAALPLMPAGLPGSPSEAALQCRCQQVLTPNTAHSPA